MLTCKILVELCVQKSSSDTIAINIHTCNTVQSRPWAVKMPETSLLGYFQRGSFLLKNWSREEVTKFEVMVKFFHMSFLFICEYPEYFITYI